MGATAMLQVRQRRLSEQPKQKQQFKDQVSSFVKSRNQGGVTFKGKAITQLFPTNPQMLVEDERPREELDTDTISMPKIRRISEYNHFLDKQRL